jgi:hypothetical protein
MKIPERVKCVRNKTLSAARNKESGVLIGNKCFKRTSSNRTYDT